jgi:hypothetical protein
MIHLPPISARARSTELFCIPTKMERRPFRSIWSKFKSGPLCKYPRRRLIPVSSKASNCFPLIIYKRIFSVITILECSYNRIFINCSKLKTYVGKLFLKEKGSGNYYPWLYMSYIENCHIWVFYPIRLLHWKFIIICISSPICWAAWNRGVKLVIVNNFFLALFFFGL